MVIDGDDELIGRYVFKTINAHYQENDYWIVYTNFVKSDYQFGTSRNLFPSFLRKNRFIKHILGHLRTWYVDLFWKIKEKDHKKNNG